MSILIIIGVSLIVIMTIFLIFPLLPNLVRKLIYMEEEETQSSENSDEISSFHFLEGAKHAKRDYRIVSGNLHPSSLDQSVVDKLASILTQNKKLKVRIFVGNQILCSSKEGDNPIWQLYKSGKFSKQLQIRVLSGYPEQHYRVVDKREFFLEENHPPLSQKRKYIIKPYSCTNAAVYASEFDKAWDRADVTHDV